MSKQDEAYKLFEQGKRPGDPELTALGLKAKTLKGYLAAWRIKKEREEAGNPPPTPKRRTRKVSPFVKVSSMKPNQLFLSGGQKYRIHRLEADRVHCMLVELHPSGLYTVEQSGRYLANDILVMPTY